MLLAQNFLVKCEIKQRNVIRRSRRGAMWIGITLSRYKDPRGILLCQRSREGWCSSPRLCGHPPLCSSFLQPSEIRAPEEHGASHLQLHRQRAHFVQNSVPRPPAQSSDAMLMRAGKGTFHVPEEFIFQQVCRNGAAVDANMADLFVTIIVDRPGNLIPCRCPVSPSITPCLFCGDQGNQAVDVLHCGLFPIKLEKWNRSCNSERNSTFSDLSCLSCRPFRHASPFVKLKRLWQKSLRPADRIDGGLNVCRSPSLL